MAAMTQQSIKRTIRRSVRIPTQGGHLFRFDGGRRSNLIPATIPI